MLLILLFIVSSALAQAQPQGHAPRCAEVIEQKLLHAGEETLDPVVQQWLELRGRHLTNRALTTHRKMQKKAGDVLSVGEQNVRVLAPLGDGTEGEVYLVQTAQGRRTAKIFYDEREMDDNLRIAQRYAKVIRMPWIENVDHKTRTALMEYIEGIPVKEIRLHSGEIGMQKKEAIEILRRFNKEKKAMTPPGQDQPPEEFNVVYSPKTKQFYLIDPF